MNSKEALEISLESEKFKSRLSAALDMADRLILESAKEGKLYANLRLSDLIPGFNHVNPCSEHIILKNLITTNLKTRGFEFETPCFQDSFFVSWRNG